MERIYYIDALKGIFMIMGVFLHSANIYHIDGNWLISDDNQSFIFNQITSIISLFRLPAFFIISGYFCLFAYRKYGADVFLARRMTQLCIPLFTTTLTLNLLQSVILYYTGAASFADHPEGWGRGFINSGAWISQLWFLVFLVIYVMIFAVLMPILESLPNSPSEGLAKHLRPRKWLIYLIAPLFFIIVKGVSSLFPHIFYRQYAGFSLIDLMHFSYFFAFGVLLYRHEHMIESLVKRPNIIAFLFYLMGAALLPLIPSDSFLYKFSNTYLKNLLVIICIFFIWQTFKSLFDRKIKLFTELSKSCYTIYLFHHIIVISLGILLMSVDMPAIIKFILISITTLATTFWIHKKIIERSIILKFLYNGKIYER